jgi:hypothetical protein
VAALVQATLLCVMAAIVLSRAGVIDSPWIGGAPWLIWIVVAFSGVAVALNAITPSAAERRIWLPVALGLLACSLTVAIGAP